MSGVCQTALWLKITLAQRYSRASLSLSGAERAAATQPARSPDVNILDEGLFHHLQVAVDKQRPGRNTNTYEARDELEKAVQEAWEAMPAEQITRTAHHLNDERRVSRHRALQGWEYVPQGVQVRCRGLLNKNINYCIPMRVYKSIFSTECRKSLKWLALYGTIY